jgi:hypothetical protein
MGSCRVEVLDEVGEPIQSFSADDCDEIHGNHIRRSVSWQGESDLSRLRGRPVHLHFAMRSCKLYAFQFALE